MQYETPAEKPGVHIGFYRPALGDQRRPGILKYHFWFTAREMTLESQTASSGYTHAGTAGTPGEGPYMTLLFRVEAGVVREAAYRTFGCVAARACAGALCAVLTGRDVARALVLDEADVARIAGGLPEGKEYCAELAVQALRTALKGGD